MGDHFDTPLFHHSVNALSLTTEDEQVIPVAYKVIGAIEVMGDKISVAGGLRSVYLRRFAFR